LAGAPGRDLLGETFLEVGAEGEDGGERRLLAGTAACYLAQRLDEGLALDRLALDRVALDGLALDLGRRPALPRGIGV